MVRIITMDIARNARAFTAGVVCLLALTGCASTPERPEHPGVTFPKPLDAVQKAAVDALVVNGFDVTKTDATYLEGYRPRKIGLIVGTGGETAGIWLESIAQSRTRVRVSTAKTFFGGAGQRSWNTEILAEMARVLGGWE